MLVKGAFLRWADYGPKRQQELAMIPYMDNFRNNQKNAATLYE